MRSRFLTLAVLLALAWWLFDFAATEDAHQPLPRTGAPLFPGLEPASVDFLSLSFRTGHVIDIEREPGGPWRITFPIEANELAQAEFVEKVLNDLSLATMVPLETADSVIDAAAVGLEDTPYSITIGIGDHRARLEIGDRDAFGNLIYVRRPGSDEIVLSTANLRNAVEQFRGEDYVDKHVVRGLRGTVNRVRIERPDGVLIDARLVPGGDWAMLEPGEYELDVSRLATITRGLQAVQQVLVAAVAPDDDVLAQLGLPNAEQVARGDWADATVIELYAEGEPPARVFLERDWQDREDAMYAIREDLYKLLEVERNAFNMLTNDADFFRQRRLMPPIGKRAHTFVVSRAGETLLDIRRDGSGRWHFNAPARLAGIEVDTHLVEGRSSLSTFLSRLDGLAAVGFCDPPTDEQAASLQIGFSMAGAERRVRVDLFDLDAELLRARVDDRPGEGLLLDRDVLQLLSPFVADELRDLLPLRVSRETWAALDIELSGLAEPLSIVRDERGSWEGDDDWGRRFGIGRDMQQNFRGYVWRPAVPVDSWDATVTFRDAAGDPLGRVRLRRLLPGEEAEALGVAVVAAVIDGVDGVQMMVPAFWLDALDGLTSDPTRTPMVNDGG